MIVNCFDGFTYFWSKLHSWIFRSKPRLGIPAWHEGVRAGLDQFRSRIFWGISLFTTMERYSLRNDRRGFKKWPFCSKQSFGSVRRELGSWKTFAWAPNVDISKDMLRQRLLVDFSRETRSRGFENTKRHHDWALIHQNSTGQNWNKKYRTEHQALMSSRNRRKIRVFSNSVLLRKWSFY